MRGLTHASLGEKRIQLPKEVAGAARYHESSTGISERQQQSGVGRSAQRRRAATILAGNDGRPTASIPTGGATRFGLP